MIACSALRQTRRLITTAASGVNSHMSEGIIKHLVLPKAPGFGIKDGALDKDAFRKVLPVLAAKIAPEKAGVLLKAPVLRRYVLESPSGHASLTSSGDCCRSLIDVPKVKSVARGPGQERLVLLKYSDQGAYHSSSRSHES